MSLLANIALYLIIIISFSGCMNFMSAKGEKMAPIRIADLDKIKTGMTKKEVVSLFGPPQSFGVDDKGRHFIHFENWQVSRTEGSFVVPFVGAVSANTSIKGIVFEVYLQDDIVKGTSRYYYQDSENKETNQSAHK